VGKSTGTLNPQIANLFPGIVSKEMADCSEKDSGPNIRLDLERSPQSRFPARHGRNNR
jgi:hypothetical protein